MVVPGRARAVVGDENNSVRCSYVMPYRTDHHIVNTELNAETAEGSSVDLA